jgi:hypothetical protein
VEVLEVVDSLTLPAGVTGLPQRDGTIALLPDEPTLRRCHQLAVRCRQLASDAGASGVADPRLPGTAVTLWVDLPEDGCLPLPVCAAPTGQPLARWLRSSDARADVLVTLLRDLVLLVDQLAAGGYVARPLRLDDVWLSEAGLSWFPAVLDWQRPGRKPTGASVQAGARAVAVLLHELLQELREVQGIGLVWEELWALCHDLLEHGYGLNSAGVAAQLEQLRLRCRGEREAAVPVQTAVLVDAASLQQVLGYRTLDLAGYLRHVLGPGRTTEGYLLVRADTPAHWRRLGFQAGLTWLSGDQLDMRAFGEQLRSAGIEDLHVFAGLFDHVAEYLPLLRPPRGTLTLLTPADAPYLPERWALGSSVPSLHAWHRMGWPVAKVVEVPDHEIR